MERFQRWIARGEELIVVAANFAGKIIGFGSIVPTNSELRAVYLKAAYGASINAVAFYEVNGFISLEPGEHIMSSGARMGCVGTGRTLLDVNYSL